MSAARALGQLYIGMPTAWTQLDFPHKAPPPHTYTLTPLCSPPTLTFTQASALALCCRHSGHIPCIPVKFGYTVFALHSVADVPSELESLLCGYKPKAPEDFCLRKFSCRLPGFLFLLQLFCPLLFSVCLSFNLLVSCTNLLQACWRTPTLSLLFDGAILPLKCFGFNID